MNNNAGYDNDENKMQDKDNDVDVDVDVALISTRGQRLV